MKLASLLGAFLYLSQFSDPWLDTSCTLKKIKFIKVNLFDLQKSEKLPCKFFSKIFISQNVIKIL
jgi:hypothetical protein